MSKVIGDTSKALIPHHVDYPFGEIRFIFYYDDIVDDVEGNIMSQVIDSNDIRIVILKFNYLNRYK